MFYRLFLFAIFICSGLFGQEIFDTASVRKTFAELQYPDSNIVVIAEAHNMKNTYETEFLILSEYFKKGYKEIYIEGGISEAHILNLFLQSGDTSLLQYTRARASNGSYKKFIIALFNANKAYKLGLKFFGFDFERTPCLNYLFRSWFQNKEIDDNGFKKQIDLLLSIQTDEEKKFNDLFRSGEKIRKIFADVKMNFKNYEDEYKDLLGTNYELFREIIFNPDFSSYFNKRDIYFTEYFLKQQRNGNLNRSVIIIGSDHVIDKQFSIPHVIDKLPVSYSSTTFLFLYKNCKELTDGFIFTSDYKCMKLMDQELTNSVIKFKFVKEKIIPVENKKATNVIAFLYNQK